MEDIYKLFQNGKYDTIIAKLTKNTLHNGLLEDLSQQNTIIICKYSKAGWNDSLEIENCLRQLTELLLKCSSIPSKPAVLALELTILWNFLYIYLKHRQRDYTRHVSVYFLINRTMYRVCSILPGYERRQASLMELNPEAVSTCYTTVNICLQSMKFQVKSSDNVMGPFCDCCRLIFVLAGLEDKEFNLAATYLQKLKELEQTTDILEDSKVTENHLSLKFSVDHRNLFLTQSSNICLTSFLIGCFQFMTDQWEDGIESLDPVIGDSGLKLAASILTGFGLFKLKKYSEAISTLMETVRSCETVSQSLRARIYNLIGMCFENKGKVQLSIQMYKEALSADFGFLRPLYNTSLQYRKLKVCDVELECLNLLVTALEMKQTSDQLFDGDESIDLLHIVPFQEIDISYLEALYKFASRALELQRYTVAADKYKHLISYLQSWETQEYGYLPSILHIHHEAILALLRANQLTDCLNLCNKVISCYNNKDSIFDLSLTYSGNYMDMSVKNASPKQTALQLSNATCTSSSRKRKREASESNMEVDLSLVIDGDPLTSQDCMYDEDIVACKYKAEVLYKLGQRDSALASAQRAIDSMSSYKKKLFTMKKEFIPSHHSPGCSHPVSKRPRLNTGLETETKAVVTSQLNTELEMKTNQLNSLHDYVKRHSISVSLEFELYTLMAKILNDIDQPSDALHFQRLASQIKPLDP